MESDLLLACSLGFTLSGCGIRFCGSFGVGSDSMRGQGNEAKKHMEWQAVRKRSVMFFYACAQSAGLSCGWFFRSMYARFLTLGATEPKNRSFYGIAIYVNRRSVRMIAAVALPDGVMVAHGPLKPLVLVRSQVGQPLLLTLCKVRLFLGWIIATLRSRVTI